jgi:predicted DsbA family dithiol-disulfide isomerase
MDAKISLAFDFLDPWGWIAERQLRLAMREVGVLTPVSYQPCRARLSSKAVGLAFQDYQRQRFGTQAGVFEKRLIAEAASLGVPLTGLDVERIPDPWLAMLAITADPKRAAALFDTVYAAIYRDGRDIGDPAVMSQLLVQTQSTGHTVAQLAESPDLMSELIKIERNVASWCRNLTPSVRIGETVVSGAQPSAVLAQILAPRPYDAGQAQ